MSLRLSRRKVCADVRSPIGGDRRLYPQLFSAILVYAQYDRQGGYLWWRDGFSLLGRGAERFHRCLESGHEFVFDGIDNP